MSNAASGRSCRLTLLLCLAAAGNACADTAGTRMRVTATVTQPCTTSLAAAEPGLGARSGPEGLAVSCSPGKAYAVEVRAARVTAPEAGDGPRRYQVTPDGHPLRLEASPGTGTPQRYRLAGPAASGGPAIVTVTF